MSGSEIEWAGACIYPEADRSLEMSTKRPSSRTARPFRHCGRRSMSQQAQLPPLFFRACDGVRTSTLFRFVQSVDLAISGRVLMKVVTWRGEAEFTIDELPMPRLESRLAIIQVDSAGVCGTDVHVTQGLFTEWDPPMVLGHEFSGVIVEIGERVLRGPDRREGRMLAATWLWGVWPPAERGRWGTASACRAVQADLLSTRSWTKTLPIHCQRDWISKQLQWWSQRDVPFHAWIPWARRKKASMPWLLAPACSGCSLWLFLNYVVPAE